MGRKSGGRPSSGFSHELLLGRLRAFSESTHHRRTLDDTVDYLRSSFPEYARFKLHPFSDTVANLLPEHFHGRDGVEVVNNNNNKHRHNPSPLPPSKAPNRSGGGGGGGGSDTLRSPLRKKFKKADEKEERLSRRETQHLRCLRRRLQGRGNPVTSSSFSSSSPSCSDNEDDKDGALSDAIYGEKVEPEFDFMRSQLRMAYAKKKAPRESSVGMNVEVDEVREKAKRVELIDGMKMGAEWRLEPKVSGSGEVKGQDGPFFRDLGGMEGVLEELKMEVVVPLYHPQLPQMLGVRPMAGILLHGPPGCGKTKLAHAIANETGVPFYKISATEVVSGVSGASEENIRDLFSKAYRSAPSIVFIDEIDAIASKRDNLHREMERRIVTQLLTCMDGSRQLKQPVHSDLNLENTNHVPGYVLVIGATNRPDALDPALRRPGRFDREIVLGVPDEKARIQILSVLTSNIRLEGSFDLIKIARSTPGFVGADLNALVNKAGNLAMKRIIDRRRFELSNEPIDEEHKVDWWRRPWLPVEMENLSITMTDFEEAAKMIQPSSRREGFSAVPNVNWENVGGLDFLRQEFDRYIVRQIKYPDWYKEFGVDLETGFLLYGPPGCGKTLIAKAVANEAGANFIHIKGPELLNKYVGESELAVRTIFSRARTCSPCILFFDEVDALTTKRGKEGGWVVERLLNQLLIELDGADTRHGVFVIGATNRPEVMDRAVLRPGRFGKLIYVPLPSPHERGLILKALARKKPIDAGVDLIAIGQMEACENLSGADLAALMNEAAMTALEDKLISASSSSESTSLTINMTHFERALKKVSPSVSDKQKRYYQNLSLDFSAS